ncbi:MAG: NAD-dependent epimerase/dehydratase family protein [Planctomycetes bacterium]|nr:NAD-dependent epimerase/dehydratase family protein [Planctomycetota bacterium]
MRVLIIGCGRLGAQCAQVLHDDGHEVYGVKRRKQDQSCPWSMFYGDASQKDFFSTLVQGCRNPDVILCTANPGFRASGGATPVSAAKEEKNDNGNGLNEIIQFIRQYYAHSRLVYTSSTYVYGDAAGAAVDEHAPTVQDNRACKLLAIEDLVSRQQQSIILRISALHSDQRRYLLERMQQATETFSIRGPLARIFNYCHDNDAAAAILAAVLDTLPESGIYNVTTPDIIDIASYYQHIMQLAQLPAALTFIEASRDQPNRRVDAAKLYAAMPSHRWQLLSGVTALAAEVD